MSEETLKPCPTCGAKSKDENVFCSDGFHAPGETYWPIPDDETLNELVETLRGFRRGWGGGLRADGKRLDELGEQAAEALLTLKADRDALRKALTKILNFSDVEMGDGDGARDVARTALTSSRTTHERPNRRTSHP